MRRGAGFTLLEVVVAGAILGVGAAALMTLQLQSLQAQRRVRVVRALVNVAEGELERRLAAGAPGEGDCTVPGADDIPVVDCRFVSEECVNAGGGYCASPFSAGAMRVSVSVEGDGGHHFELRELAAPFPGR